MDVLFNPQNHLTELVLLLSFLIVRLREVKELVQSHTTKYM